MALRRVLAEIPFRFGRVTPIETEFCQTAWRWLSTTPDGYHFAKTHEWIKDAKDGSIRVGISHFAQNELGEVVYVEVPEVGTSFGKGDTFGVIESVKVSNCQRPHPICFLSFGIDPCAIKSPNPAKRTIKLNISNCPAASDVYAPVAGEVVEVNEKLADEPGLVNISPFTDGWIMKLKSSEPGDVSSLMAKDAYDSYCESLSH